MSTAASLARAFDQAAPLVRDCDTLFVAAGAGMGVDSGLPDFRGNDGFWRAYPALRKAGLEFTSIASPAAFVESPERAWGFYGHRLRLYRDTVPNPGFAILKRWEESAPNGCSVFTSNVDGQFQKAGFGETLVQECHGSIHHLQCMIPCTTAIWPANAFEPEIDEQHCVLTSPLPRCPHCGGLARPNILMFGDADWLASRAQAQAARQAARLARAQRPLVIEIGAGSAIPSVRRFSELMVRRHDGRLIRINPAESDVADSLDVGLPCRGLEALREIDALLGVRGHPPQPVQR